MFEGRLRSTEMSFAARETRITGEFDHSKVLVQVELGELAPYPAGVGLGGDRGEHRKRSTTRSASSARKSSGGIRLWSHQTVDDHQVVSRSIVSHSASCVDIRMSGTFSAAEVVGVGVMVSSQSEIPHALNP